MRAKTLRGIGWLLIVAVIATSSAWAKKKDAPSAPLTERGNELLAKYTAIMEKLKAELTKAIPSVDERKMAAFQEAREAEKGSEARLAAAQKGFGEINKWRGLVHHANWKWIGGADKAITAAKERIKSAKTKAERKTAQEDLAKAEKGRQAGLDARKERQANLDKALAREPELKKELEAAKAELAEAKANTTRALKRLGLERFLKSNKLDGDLAKFVILADATPRGLAAYAQQGGTQEELIEKLLDDDGLMVQIAASDGANGKKYGRAMEIYTAIQKASRKSSDGALQKLALGIALEHAVPIGQRSPTALTDAPKVIDPVKRYLHYEKAYLSDELDPKFKELEAWDYRMVVNGNEPDETLAWGREMLRSYRPDHITNPDYRWRYVGAVRTDIRYGSQYNRLDKPELQFFQNILANGGVYGRRAFFGRFMLRAFGVPTTARPQRGHAALAHYTPDGWVVCLGGGWGIGWVGVGGRGRSADLDFLAVTQGRATGDTYMQVLRAQWAGDVLGEKRAWGLKSGVSDLWNSVALYWQRAIIEEAKAVTLAAVGEELGEANESRIKYAIETAPVTEADRKVTVKRGVITIPAAATSRPRENAGRIKFMPSTLGGMQLHYGRTGEGKNFEYTFDAPKAGKYKLTARVAVPTPDQLLLVAVNGAEKPTEIALPYTIGLWGETKPVEVELVAGRNVLTFSRGGDDPHYIRGLTIRDFTLKL